MVKRNILLALAAVATAWSAPALASPAQDLFDQATFYVGFNYFGPGKITGGFRGLRAQYQGQLDAACGAQKDACPFEKALPVIDSMIKALNDPFTTILSEDEFADQVAISEGRGPSEPRIGVKVRPLEGQGLVIVDAFPGEPAWEAGLQRGDVIATVNGAAATPANLAAAEAGKAPVKVSYSRNGTAQTVDLAPRVAQESYGVSSRETGKVMIIRVPHLYGSESVSLGDRVHRAVRRGINDGMKGFVIDLRDAESGYDTEALLAAGAFIKDGGFIYRKRFVDSDDKYTLDSGRVFEETTDGRQPVAEAQSPQLTNLPVVVLVNRYTTNSSEMLAYFLQHAGRAKVVGEPTSGQLSVSGGVEGQLLNGMFVQVSSFRMFNLDNTTFPDRITPDVVVPDDLQALSQGRDVQLDKALELLGIK